MPTFDIVSQVNSMEIENAVIAGAFKGVKVVQSRLKRGAHQQPVYCSHAWVRAGGNKSGK